MIDEVITNLFDFTFKDNALDWCKTTWGNFWAIKLWIWSRFLQMILNNVEWWICVLAVKELEIGSNNVDGSVLCKMVVEVGKQFANTHYW